MTKQIVNIEDNYLKCMRCKTKVSRINVIDISSLTAKADSWRDISGAIKICPKCSNELIKIIDKWWPVISKA